MSFQKGQKLDCPHCEERVSVTIKTEMDGWEKVGEYFACGLCGGKLEDDSSEAHDALPTGLSDAGSKLEDFLGTSKADNSGLISDDGTRPFCKNCKHFLEHPFEDRCGLHDRPTDPMDDCDAFEQAPS
jgi:hypothetical protein